MRGIKFQITCSVSPLLYLIEILKYERNFSEKKEICFISFEKYAVLIMKKYVVQIIHKKNNL